jgi:Yip1-like protein/zinc ribbon protein
MKFCPQCGSVADSSDRFCQSCGYNLTRPDPAPQPPASEHESDKTVLMPSRRPPEAPAGDSGAGGASAAQTQNSRSSSGSGAGMGAPPPPSSSGRPGPDPFSDAQARSAWFGWLLARIKNILLKPNDEWPVIEAEPATVTSLYTAWIIPLGAAAALAGWLGKLFILFSLGFGVAFFGGLITAVVAFALGLVMVFLVALLVDALAPSFGGQKNQLNALKVIAFAYTPNYIGGLLMIIPPLAPLLILFGLYGLYLLYLGLPVLMKCPREKSLVYTIVVVVTVLVLSLVIGLVSAGVTGLLGLGIMGKAGLGGLSSSGGVPGLAAHKPEAVKRLEEMAQKMEAAGKKMEAAEKSGDSAAAAAAAGEVLGTALSGGRKVEPVDFRELKALLPESIAGMKRSQATGEKSGMGGLTIATAEARYGEQGGRSVEIKVTDMGGAGLGMMGLAAWAMVEMDKETENGHEKTGKLDGRPFHEQYNDKTRSGEFSLVVAQRFLVEAKGGNVDLDTLKGGVTAVNLARLEAMKDVGAKN